jgi:hypothetical protein
MQEGLKNFWHLVSLPDNVPIIGMLGLVIFYTWQSMRKAIRNDRLAAPIEASMTDRVQVWPYLVRIEFLTSVVVILILTVWSVGIDAPLEEPANPGRTPNPSKAPWYFLGLQEMLVYFDPWLAGIVFPFLIQAGLMAIPYVDINPKGNGYYTWKERRFAIGFFLFGFLILWVFLIVLGTLLRGPGWNFFFPWEEWDAHKVVAANSRDWPELFGKFPAKNVDGSMNIGHVAIGLLSIVGYYVAGDFLLRKVVLPRATKDKDIVKKLGPLRYGTVSFFVLTCMTMPIKIILRLTLDVKYVLSTPWINF